MLRIYGQKDGCLLPTASGIDGAPADDAVWFDLVNPTAEEDRAVEERVGLSIPTREEMQEIELSSRLYSDGGGEFMTATALVSSDDDPAKTPVTFILKGRCLVTVRYAEPKFFDLFAARAQKQNTINCATGERVMLALLETMVARLADVLERTSDETDAISREIFRRKASVKRKTRNLEVVIEQLGRKGDLLAMTRESLVSVTRLLSYHQAVEGSGRQGAKSLQRDVAALGDHAAFLSNKVSFLLDATLGLINLQQNQIIKIFSVAAVIFLPPTLVASIYGMNFRHMPELEWLLGYPWALGLMALSAAVPFLYFKQRGWL